MSSIKDGRYPIILDRERHLLFSLNVIDEIQDKTGDISNLMLLFEGKDTFKNLKWLLMIAINEGAADGEEPITEKQVGKMVHPGNMNYVKDTILKAFKSGMSGDTPETDTGVSDEEEDDDEKNLKSGQGQ